MSDWTETIEELDSKRDAEMVRFDEIQTALGSDLPRGWVTMPKEIAPQMFALAKKVHTNYLPLVVDQFAQSLRVSGYRTKSSLDNTGPWRYWQSNGMDAKQSGLFRSTLKFGVSYTIVLPGNDGPLILPRSPRRLSVLWGDAVDDEYPQVASERRGKDGRRIYTDEKVIDLTRVTGSWEVASEWDHGMGVCPVVRFTETEDLDEQGPVGIVEPLIPIQQRIDETVFGLIMAQFYSAFQQRYVVGWLGNDEQKQAAAVSNLWTFEDPDVKPGQFPATDPTGYLKSKESAVQDMAAIAQVPPHALLGSITNLSAEALAGTQDGRDRRADEMKAVLGESVERTLRLAALADGDTEAATDLASEVRWADTTARSFAQQVDGLGKLAAMLQIPAEALWERVPDVTDQELAEWKQLAAEGDTLADLLTSFSTDEASGGGQ